MVSTAVGLVLMLVAAGEPKIHLEVVADQASDKLNILVVDENNEPVVGADVTITFKHRGWGGLYYTEQRLDGKTDPEGWSRWQDFNHDLDRDIHISASHPQHGSDRKLLSWKLSYQLARLDPAPPPEPTKRTRETTTVGCSPVTVVEDPCDPCAGSPPPAQYYIYRSPVSWWPSFGHWP